MVVEFSYQFQYELCSLIFLICITIQFFSSKRFPTVTNYIFQWILISGIADLALDVLGCITIEYIEIIPVWINYLVNGLFYCIQTILPALMSTYIIYNLGLSYRKNPKLALTLVPAATFLIVHLINPFTGLLFSIKEVEGNLRFVQGPMVIGIYALLAFYMGVLFALTITYRTRMTRKQILTILLFSFLVTAATLLQMMFPYIILSGTGIALTIMLWDLTLQNPEHMLDESSGAFNLNALQLFLTRSIIFGHIYATVVEIDGLAFTDKGHEVGTSEIIPTKIGTFFSKLTPKRVWYFRESENRFWVFSKNQNELDRMSSMIADRFNESWEADGYAVELLAKVLYFSTNTSIMVSASELISIIGEALENEGMITRQKNKYVIDSGILARYRRHHVLEESMRRSVKNGEGFYICFQPIISLDPNGPTTAEVLLRYNDPNLGAVSPTEFIPVIESCGLSMFIDNFVIDSASRFISNHPEIDKLHINLSASEFFSNPVKRISSIVLGYGVSPSRICFEITESAATKNPEMLDSFMKQMIALGFSFALDDYGTGYSNALQVIRMPFKTVKIDKVLLSDGQKSRGFLEGTIRMLIELGMDTVVEGVETKEQLDRVKSYGVTNIQGFLFSPPLIDVDYIAFVNKTKGKEK